ncbi:MAG: phosphoadenosine phosphosulfate reductase family protein [Bacteroidales bacterium]
MLSWEQWKRACLVHARSLRFKEKVRKANELITDVLLKHDNPAIAFSTGKDSTVVYHLVKDIGPDIDVFHNDHEWMLTVSRHYLNRIQESDNVISVKFEDKHCDWFITNKGSSDSVTYDLVFLGLRAEENGYRKKYMRANGLYSYSGKYSQFNCSPIGWWTIEDVWGYIFSTDRDYNRAYEIMNNNGIPIDRQRIGPFANKLAMQYGQIAILKQCFPDDYNLFIKEYPEAKGYV